ncbi:ROK family transcriptional regulator [Amycolatopsis sp.]|uniref:ROK family transcriptional regulator n=1 Tax=Amycolatopsis sp. TaxID=37632 RepID=UPI002D7F5512|nr:ROK family transcriptional regulator [Amycolatopsis sp.]HET6705361.1 ROK family transcriptional regulator [Amycolatopsis sp.]
MSSGPPRTTPHASTRAVVLDVIRAAGTISRVGIVAATGMTGATISTVVRGLIDDGLVVETGRAESTGGKRRVLLQLDPAARFAVGIHLDQAGVTYALTDLSGAVVARTSRPGPGSATAAEVVAEMAAEAATLVTGAGIDRTRLLGFGLVFPGPLAPAGVSPPSMRQWLEYPLGEELRRVTGLPVLVENDAAAAALGELWSGGAGTSATFAAVYMGTGIGAGLLVNGLTFRGTSGNTGEIGHVCLDLDGPECWCGARGCLEALAGPAAVVSRARADSRLARAAGLRGTSVPADFGALSRAARRGDAAAVALLERSARYVAVGVRTLANVMDLEAVVLTGPSFAIAGASYVPAIREELERAFFARAVHVPDVRLSRAAATAPAIGGAAMVLQSELVPLHDGLRLPGPLDVPEPPLIAPA